MIIDEVEGRSGLYFTETRSYLQRSTDMMSDSERLLDESPTLPSPDEVGGWRDPLPAQPMLTEHSMMYNIGLLEWAEER